MTAEGQAFVVFSAGMLVLMGIGMNMALALVLTGAGMAWVLGFWDTQLLAQNLVAGVDSFPLLAVPFFILAGELMNSGGISRRIIDMAQAWVGHIRGGLGYVAIGAAVLMASMSGSALADTAALATILLPMMRRQGYPMNTSAGLLASGGIIAPIIPPSMPFVIYGVTTNTSISALFVSGIVPGLIMGAGLIVAWKWVLRRIELPAGEPLPLRERLRATAKAFWAMLMPVIIIGGMKTGIFTPTEAAVVAAFYALVVALTVHREMKIAEIQHVLVRAARTTAIVMFLCAGAQVASYMITLADLPSVLTGWLGPLVGPPRPSRGCADLFRSTFEEPAMNLFRHTFIAACAAAALAGPLAAAAADIKPHLIRFGYGLNEQSNQGRAVKVFAEQVEKASGGK